MSRQSKRFNNTMSLPLFRKLPHCFRGWGRENQLAHLPKCYQTLCILSFTRIRVNIFRVLSSFTSWRPHQHALLEIWLDHCPTSPHNRSSSPRFSRYWEWISSVRKRRQLMKSSMISTSSATCPNSMLHSPTRLVTWRSSFGIWRYFCRCAGNHSHLSGQRLATWQSWDQGVQRLYKRMR